MGWGRPTVTVVGSTHPDCLSSSCLTDLAAAGSAQLIGHIVTHSRRHSPPCPGDASVGIVWGRTSPWLGGQSLSWNFSAPCDPQSQPMAQKRAEQTWPTRSPLCSRQGTAEHHCALAAKEPLGGSTKAGEEVHRMCHKICLASHSPEALSVFFTGFFGGMPFA